MDSSSYRALCFGTEGLPTPSRSPTTSTDSSLDLPFPTPLPRHHFLTPDFSPQSYLSSLGPRHQTLEDLRSDLQTRSQQLSAELLDLVNGHYEDFLALGGSVKGQSDRVEEIRLGVWGVRRDVEAVQKMVAERERAVEGLVRERRGVKREMQKARELLKWEEGISRLEGKLEKKQLGGEGDDDESDWSTSAEEDEDEDSDAIDAARLKRRVRDVLHLQRSAERLGHEHPFAKAQWSRLLKVRQTVVLDVRQALSNARERKDSSAVIECLSELRKLDARWQPIAGERKGKRR
ncbi:MAG: hypothetical protein Q9162_003078 [Coniocarpon cinnabarinum]